MTGKDEKEGQSQKHLNKLWNKPKTVKKLFYAL